jgi:UDP-N-acetyl-D-glucosamine dehydrogenase
MKIGILGQGYVGLPLSLAAVESGYDVVGFEVDKLKIQTLKEGKSPFEGIQDAEIEKAISTDRYTVTSELKRLSETIVKVICLPTPLNNHNKPDLSQLILGVKMVAKVINPGDLVIIESTIAPGTTRNLIGPLLEQESKLSTHDFLLAFSPERIDPANAKWNITNTPKIVAGLTPQAANAAVEFYSKFIKLDNLHLCSSLEVAEISKLIENSFRLINISFINEIAMLCNKMEISITDVIKAAMTKPYGFMGFYPSLGAGGHCIPVDPIYLLDKAEQFNLTINSIKVAATVNSKMPDYFLSLTETKLGKLKGKKILVIGLAYKPNVSDIRESPAVHLYQLLEQRGAIVEWHDDLVKSWNGMESRDLDDSFEFAILATKHDYLDLKKLGNTPLLVTQGS